MRRWNVVWLLLLASLLPAHLHAARPVSFNLSTNRTFAPTEKPTIHLYAQNVDELEFRVYRVNDAAKFLASLRELHSFDNGTPFGPEEQIDERTWLEKFHDWKHHLWFLVREFFRNQFTAQNRDRLRAHQASLAKRSRIVGVAQFAQIPLLNDHQLVARWKQELPPTYVSDSQELPIDPLPSDLYLVEATDGHYKAYTLLMVSRMVMVTRTANGTVLAYTVDRQSGAGIDSVAVKAGIGQQAPIAAETDKDGLATLKLSVPKPAPDNFWVLATKGDEIAVVTPGGYSLSGWQGGRWSSYIYTDRPVYRPGNVVHWKGILRARVDNHLELPKLKTIHVTIADQEDHPLVDKDLPLSAAGNVEGDLTLPATATLGYYTVRLRDGPASDDMESDAGSGQFRVDDYRKPEYQVRVSPVKQRILQGETMQVVIDARYFFGEPVSNATVKYRVYHSQHYWWDSDASGDDNSGGDDNPGVGYDAAQQSEQTGKLNADGKLTISVPTQYNGDQRKGSDQDYTVEAAVTDEANREITGRGRFLATRGTFRIHVEPVSYAVRVGEAALMNVTAVDYDNHPVSTRVHLQLVMHRFVNGVTKTTRGGSTDVTTDANGRGQGSIPVTTAGSAEVEATAITPENRVVFDGAYLWIMGGNEAGWGGDSRSVQMIADKKSYAPGETAHISILSNVDSFHPLVVATGYTVEFQKVMFSPGKSLTFDLPITAGAQPNLDINTVFIRNGQLYQAYLRLNVPPIQQQLQIDITPDKQVFQPQQAAGYDVFARDWQGKPVSADFSFGVVDEAIYSLYPDSSGDMVKKLYPDRWSSAAIDSSLEYYFSGRAGLKSPMLAERRSSRLLAQVKPGNDVVQPRVRKAFPDTAYWSPSVHTAADGHAHVTLTFPDSLTTWRTTVHAITLDSRAGSAINRVLVRKNIIVRMGTPRFLRQGDEVTIPVIVHNYLDQAKQVQLSLDIKGLDPVSGSPQSVNVTSKGEATALWRVKASRIGTAQLLAKALTNEDSDALELTFPVEPIGVPVTLSNSGVITDNQAASVNVNFPADTDPAAHSIHVEVAPSIAGSLFSALGYLATYPYGCTEQTISSFLPSLVVANTLKKLNLPELVSAPALTTRTNAGLDRINDLKHDDGGWGWWKEDASTVFMTAYVVSGLAQARDAGYAKAAANLDGGVAYLQKQLAEHPRMLPELRAYVVYALVQAGEKNTGSSIETLWSRRNDLSAEGLALTGLVMLKTNDSRAAQIAQLLEAKANRAGLLVSWPSSYSPLLDIEESDGDNTAESTAFALRFLTRADAKSPLLEGAAQWLVVNRSNGYWWNSTEQTAMVLFGLTDYLAASQELNANFDVDVMVNGSSVGKRHFSAADALSGANLVVDIPAAQLQPGSNTVNLRKRGNGRAYWSTQGKYFSTAQKLYQHGTLSLNLTRDYFKLVPATKDGNIVYQLQPLKGAVKIGDTLAVHLAVNGSPAKYLLVEDPIAAGTEFLQQTDGYNIVDQPQTWEYWYTRSEFHDDHAAFFATEFSGRHESFYLLKVVNPGSFSVSPANVVPMYQPGIQATTDLLHLDVEGNQ